jgi:hypothetical protein
MGINNGNGNTYDIVPSPHNGSAPHGERSRESTETIEMNVGKPVRDLRAAEG